MTFQEFEALVAHLRKIGKDTQFCEVKESVGKLPSSIVETLSAFSNGSGGAIILGLSERYNFTPARGFSASKMQDALVDTGEKLTPVVRPEIDIFPFEDSDVLVAHIYPMPIEDKPCYVTARGLYRGSYIRTGDGDRCLSKYEIDRLIEGNRQPRWDAEIVPDATIADLDDALVRRLVERQKTLHPRIFQHMSKEDVLVNLRVLAEANGMMRPTVAGLLALGQYPQKFFPTLTVSFTRYPHGNEDNTSTFSSQPKSPDYRFLDNQTLVGSLPFIIADAVDCVRKNMNTGAVIDGAFRRDLPDYPLIAVREAVANALQHRDYSTEGRGSAVSINMYPDRLEIQNPGGLFGRVTLEDLGKPGITASRNQFLSTILETTPYLDEGFVVDNRGSGIRAITSSLEQADMFPAEIRTSLTNFSITFLKRRRTISEKTRFAGKELEQAILTELDTHSTLSLRELIAFSGRSRSLVSNRIKQLVAEGLIEPTEPLKSPKQRYRKVR